MRGAHEGDGKIGALAGHFRKVTPRLRNAPELTERRDQYRVAGPLEIGLAQRLERESDRALVVRCEVFGVRNADEKRAHIGVVRAQANGRLEMAQRLRGLARKHERRAEAVVRKRQARVELERDLELGNGRRVLAPKVTNAPERAVRAGIVAIKGDRAMSGLDRLFAILFVRFRKAIDYLVIVGISFARTGRAKLGIYGDCLPEEPARLQ